MRPECDNGPPPVPVFLVPDHPGRLEYRTDLLHHRASAVAPVFLHQYREHVAPAPPPLQQDAFGSGQQRDKNLFPCSPFRLARAQGNDLALEVHGFPFEHDHINQPLPGVRQQGQQIPVVTVGGGQQALDLFQSDRPFSALDLVQRHARHAGLAFLVPAPRVQRDLARLPQDAPNKVQGLDVLVVRAGGQLRCFQVGGILVCGIGFHLPKLGHGRVPCGDPVFKPREL